MSDAALLSPRAPVGGTMWAASPARNRRPYRIGSATKLRSGAMLFSIDGPVVNPAAISPDSRRVSSGPEGIVRPVLSRIRQRHLDVEAVR